MSGAGEHYDPEVIAFLGALWGEGYMSPGGPEEVARILEGLDLANGTVLDIGSGSGGITVDLVRRHGAGRVVGIDVEASVCAAARQRVERAGLADRVEIRLVEPGPLPFPEASFDLVFSKDSIVHVPDKETLAREAFRVLKPGGRFAVSDVVVRGDVPPEIRRSMELWVGCVAGALEEKEFEGLLRDSGFEDPSLEPTRTYRAEDARSFLEEAGLDVDVFADAVDGRFMSAFVRARKPEAACCGPSCCG